MIRSYNLKTIDVHALYWQHLKIIQSDLFAYIVLDLSLQKYSDLQKRHHELFFINSAACKNL